MHLIKNLGSQVLKISDCFPKFIKYGYEHTWLHICTYHQMGYQRAALDEHNLPDPPLLSRTLILQVYHIQINTPTSFERNVQS